MDETTSNEFLEPLIFAIRGHRVILDADLARLYGISTRRFNEAFGRNRRRFPEDFAFRLTVAEFEKLRTRLATTSTQPADSIRQNWSQFATTLAQHRRATHRPWAFTEHGALMAANILRSERAVQMSVFVVRALPLLQPPADPPKRRIGFHTDHE